MRPLPRPAYPHTPAVPKRLHLTVDRPEVNDRFSLIVVPQYLPHDPRSQITLDPQGHRGFYCVTLILAVPGSKTFHSDMNFEQLVSTGDSLLQVPQGSGITHLRVKVYNEAESAEVSFSINVEGHLATAIMRVIADNFLNAERYAHDLVLPLLSRWSFVNDVAIDIAAYHIVEEATQAQKYRFGAIGKVRVLTENPTEMVASTPENRQLLAAYREGLNASNVFFQVLSFFKVTEGIRHLRTIRAQKARTNGMDVERYDEVIPTDFADIPHSRYIDEGVWRPYLGK
ncbi:MAG: hypothetical protein M1298_00790 [Chloroflexi bacterium]|nr:hypothetical protein [Chloroflexota bacterium]